MIALDTNIVVPLLVASHPDHYARTREFLALSQSFCVTAINMGETLRLLTHPKVFEKPMRLSGAVAHLESFLAEFSIRVLYEDYAWWRELARLSEGLADIFGNEVFDARIALCLRYNGVREIWTMDADFQKYDFLALHGHPGYA